MCQKGVARELARWGVWVWASGCAASAFAFSTPAEELKYMSPRCASMLEAQRTAPNAVRRTPSYAELQANYQRQCGENQSMARQRLYEEKRQQQKEAALENRQQQKEKLENESQAKLQSTQCLEMRSALESRKKRPNPSEGDLRDLGLFEDRYKAKCL